MPRLTKMVEEWEGKEENNDEKKKMKKKDKSVLCLSVR